MSLRIIVLPVGRCRFLEENESGLPFRRNKIWRFTECMTPTIDIHHCHRASQVVQVLNCFHFIRFQHLKETLKGEKRGFKSINRKNPTTGKNWQPSEDDRICSKHFVERQPTVDHPCPAVDMGVQQPAKRNAKTRTIQK